MPFHGHCIHNDHGLKTRPLRFTMKGMFAAVIWIALWSSFFAAIGAHSARRNLQAMATVKGQHFMIGSIRPGESVGFAECIKCGLDSRTSGAREFYGPCPENRVSSK